MENNGNAIFFWGGGGEANKVHFGRFASGDP